ncbi:uncharacterized protein N7479_010854 [Penicillium vulpinum]|uniref:uncharacterized protein n=1 Tax=Penicillium vulpinum TaxID=29845 RepID=UPI002548B1DF|nr:uncharacterized protein N7479_010854 [Penicillium vulpinum]KAJ5952441.1 hypothetical protein N7479_010854 [Penicillium vulpinum]
MLYSLLFILVSLLSQSFTLAAAVQTSSLDRLQTVEDESNSVISFYATLSPTCTSDLNELKAQYNTLFDGDYSSKFDDILALCYTMNYEANRENSEGFGLSYPDKFDKVRENCCHEEANFTVTEAWRNLKLYWKYLLFSVSFCLLVVFKSTWVQINLRSSSFENDLQNSETGKKAPYF